jgi:nitrite reductase/ring-hydroxylating ferredoxin subunit
MTSGGSASFKGSSYSDPACSQPDIIVVANGGGEFVAFSASCPHACCVVAYKSSEFKCPCHGATFDASTGACTNGKTPTPLTKLTLCADSTGVTVTW